jgi:hypothetical protein
MSNYKFIKLLYTLHTIKELKKNDKKKIILFFFLNPLCLNIYIN